VDEYKKRNITLHVDNEREDDATRDVLVAWAHFIRADIFIMGLSSFSHVPAILNPNCVVYQPMWHGFKDDWIVIDNTVQPRLWDANKQGEKRGMSDEQLTRFFSERLPRCLAHI